MAEVLCESLRAEDGVRCSKTASWIVRVGTRDTDAQWSCGTHLHQTCTVMYGSEERAGATLTLTPVHPYER